jgi:hypothetical protein
MPRNATSCGRNSRLTDRKTANAPDRKSVTAVNVSAGRPSPINSRSSPRSSSRFGIVWVGLYRPAAAALILT